MNYYREIATGDYHVVTKESPRQFKGVLFVGKGPPLGSGDGINAIAEQVYPAQFLGTKLVPATPPDEWRYAFGEKPAPVIVDGEVVDLMPLPEWPGRRRAKKPTGYDAGMLLTLILFIAYILWR